MLDANDPLTIARQNRDKLQDYSRTALPRLKEMTDAREAEAVLRYIRELRDQMDSFARLSIAESLEVLSRRERQKLGVVL